MTPKRLPKWRNFAKTGHTEFCSDIRSLPKAKKVTLFKHFD